MNKVTSENTILEMLDQRVLENDCASLIKQIKAFQEKYSYIPDKKNISIFNALRTKSSNTLSYKRDLENWDKANFWINEQISNKTFQNSLMAQKLNTTIVGLEQGIRSESVFSGEQEYLPPRFIKKSLENLDSFLIEEKNPLIKAFECYYQIVTIHPFKDGNGRTARMFADWVLLEHCYPPIIFRSSINSFVSTNLNGPVRCKKLAFENFLKSIIDSYCVLYDFELTEAYLDISIKG